MLFKRVETIFKFSMSNLSTSNFELAKSNFWQMLMYQHLQLFISDSVAYLERPNTVYIFLSCHVHVS